jgi:hypothetical protein
MFCHPASMNWGWRGACCRLQRCSKAKLWQFTVGCFEGAVPTIVYHQCVVLHCTSACSPNCALLFQGPLETVLYLAVCVHIGLLLAVFVYARVPFPTSLVVLRHLPAYTQ